jgi:hypothetical protein
LLILDIQWKKKEIYLLALSFADQPTHGKDIEKKKANVNINQFQQIIDVTINIMLTIIFTYIIKLIVLIFTEHL